METASSSFPANFCLGFSRCRSPNEVSAISLQQSPAKFRQSYRLGSVVGEFWVKHGLQKVLVSVGSSPPSSNADKGKIKGSSSSGADGAPLPNILAGIVVFLLFVWVLGSITWIVGLTVNAPSS